MARWALQSITADCPFQPPPSQLSSVDRDEETALMYVGEWLCQRGEKSEEELRGQQQPEGREGEERRWTTI